MLAGIGTAPTVVAGAPNTVGRRRGADALWLARQGWQVTAVDVAPTAVRAGHSAARAPVPASIRAGAVTGALPADLWEVDVAEPRSRPGAPGGHRVSIEDLVVKARRKPS
jgi:hypothetical protein